MKRDTPSIIEFTTDPQLLGLSLSPAQTTLLKSIYGLSLNAEESDIYRQCTGPRRYPGTPVREATVIAGGRGGKDSRCATPVLSYEATFG